MNSPLRTSLYFGPGVAKLVRGHAAGGVPPEADLFPKMPSSAVARCQGTGIAGSGL